MSPESVKPHDGGRVSWARGQRGSGRPAVAVGRIREMAPRCKARTRTGLVEIGFLVVQEDRVAGVRPPDKKK